MANHNISGTYSEILRKLESTDPVHKDVFNPLFGQLLNNDANLRQKIENLTPSTKRIWGTAAPTTGTWKIGDVVENTSPTSAKNINRWVCVQGGTPGAWRAVGIGFGHTIEQPTLGPNDAGYIFIDIDL